MNNDLHIVQHALEYDMVWHALEYDMVWHALEYDMVWHAVKLGSAFWKDWLPEKSVSRAILFVH